MADVTLTVDGKKFTAPAGTLLIEACKSVGIEVPSFCYYPNLSLQGACRMCLVKIEKMPKLQTACTTVVSEGMIVTSNSDEVKQARKSMIEMLLGWLDRYPIASIEDPLAEDDRDGWAAFARAAATRVEIVGDDYLTTSAARVTQAATDGACNAVLIKPNQAGTVTETLAALAAGRTAGMATIVSARSGETEDVSIVHLAVGWNAGRLKVGSFARSERMAKWNEALRIEESLGAAARFAGRGAVSAWPERPGTSG